MLISKRVGIIVEHNLYAEIFLIARYTTDILSVHSPVLVY
jgi:hypothetical protein